MGDALYVYAARTSGIVARRVNGKHLLTPPTNAGRMFRILRLLHGRVRLGLDRRFFVSCSARPENDFPHPVVGANYHYDYPRAERLTSLHTAVGRKNGENRPTIRDG